MDTTSSKHSDLAYPLPRLVVALTALALLAFLTATPGGPLTKADLVASAVCHRIPSHSFTVAGRQLPLCARCSGTFLGALVALVGQAFVLRRRRAAEFPPVLVIVVLVGFTSLWAADGLNSYLALIGGPHVYQPQNWLRLAAGALNGTTMSALIFPVFNVTLWRHPTGQPAIRGLRDLGVLLLLEAGVTALVLSRLPFLLYPLAFLSAVGVLTVLTSVNSVIAMVFLRRENVVDTWRQAALPLMAGLTMSLIEIGVIVILRYGLTGTLKGIPPMQ